MNKPLIFVLAVFILALTALLFMLPPGTNSFKEVVWIFQSYLNKNFAVPLTVFLTSGVVSFIVSRGKNSTNIFRTGLWISLISSSGFALMVMVLALTDYLSSPPVWFFNALGLGIGIFTSILTYLVSQISGIIGVGIGATLGRLVLRGPKI